MTFRVAIRRGRPDDVPALSALARRTIGASYRSFLGDEGVDGFLESGASDRYVAENAEGSAVLLCEGEIVGFAVCRDERIDHLMIDAPRHRMGLGAVLLKHVEAELLRSHAAIRLESFADNDPANAFYRKHGWVEGRRWHDAASGVDKVAFTKAAPTSRRAT